MCRPVSVFDLVAKMSIFFFYCASSILDKILSKPLDHKPIRYRTGRFQKGERKKRRLAQPAVSNLLFSLYLLLLSSSHSYLFVCRLLVQTGIFLKTQLGPSYLDIWAYLECANPLSESRSVFDCFLLFEKLK